MRLRFAPCLLAVLSLSACDIGQGSKLESLTIIPASGSEGDTTVRMFECFRDQLALRGSFTDGGAGNFTGRATWTSSDPAVVRVSNNDIAVPEIANTFFFNGVLIPVAPGTATVTADFVGLRAQIAVTVSPYDPSDPSNVFFELASQPNVATAGPVFVAAGAAQGLRIKARVNGRVLDKTGEAYWQYTDASGTPFTTAPPSVFVTDNAGNDFFKFSGVIRAQARDANLRARARFLPCETARTQPSIAINVGDVRTLTLAREDGFVSVGDGNGNLRGDLVVAEAVGTGELLQLFAGLDVNGDNVVDGVHELGTQGTYTVTPSGTAPYLTLNPGSGLTNLVFGSPLLGKSGVGQGDVISASFQGKALNPADTNQTTDLGAVVNAGNTLTLDTVRATLTQLSITPTTAAVSAFETQGFEAVGQFTADTVTETVSTTNPDGTVATTTNPVANSFAGGATSANQKVTRLLAWQPCLEGTGGTTGVSCDSAPAILSNTPSVATRAFITSLTNPDPSLRVTVTATPVVALSSSSTLAPATATLTVNRNPAAP